MSKACSVIDFIVIHSYPIWDMNYYDYAHDVEGKLDFQVRRAPLFPRPGCWDALCLTRSKALALTCGGCGSQLGGMLMSRMLVVEGEGVAMHVGCMGGSAQLGGGLLTVMQLDG